MSKKQKPTQAPAPEWLKRSTLSLPPWARKVDTHATEKGKVSICIEADTDAYVPYWLDLLGVAYELGMHDGPPVDEYWLEVAYQCAKMDLQLAIQDTDHDPRHCRMSSEFRFTRSEKWKQVSFPKGRGAAAATQGREAREHFKRVRGRIPFSG